MTAAVRQDLVADPALVLLHALGQDAGAWRLVGWPGAFTPTLPGFRQGPVVARSLAEMADEVAESAPPSFHLAGVAFGGIVAQHVLLRHPGRVRSALLACTTATVGDPEPMRRLALEARSRGLVALAPTLLARWFTPAALDRDDPGVRYVRQCLDRLPAEGYANALDAAALHETRAALGSIQVPVTLVVGLDDHVGRGTVEAMAEHLPGARLRLAPGPHMLHLERPEVIREELRLHLEWVADLERAAASLEGPAS